MAVCPPCGVVLAAVNPRHAPATATEPAYLDETTKEKTVRITKNAKNDVSYFAFDTTADWNRSTTPHLYVLADWATDGTLTGLAFGGPLAEVAVAEGVRTALKLAVAPEILDPITGAPGVDIVDHEELKTIAELVLPHYEHGSPVETALAHAAA